MDKKAFRNRIIVTSFLGIGIFLFEYFIKPGELIEQINNPVLKFFLIGIHTLLVATAIFDIGLIIKDIAKFLFSARTYKLWNKIKGDVKSQLTYVETNWEGIEEIINKVCNIYPNYVCNNVEDFLEHLSREFYKDDNKKEEIAYFFISNRINERIKNFLISNVALNSDCEEVAENVKINFFNTKFTVEKICKDNVEFQSFVNGIRFWCISSDKFDEHIYDTLKKFITCFNEAIDNKGEIDDLQIFRILQIIWKIENKLERDYIECHDDKIVEQGKKLQKELNEKWIISNVNKICKELVDILKLKDISKDQLTKYINKATVVLSHWEKISFSNKLRLALNLYNENEHFNKYYHKEETTTKAIMLLLGAEILSVDFNPKEDLNGRMGALIVSVAGLVLG